MYKRQLYDSIEDESYAELDESEVTTANILTRLLRLSQITGCLLYTSKRYMELLL